jgi:hypothetical protein
VALSVVGAGGRALGRLVAAVANLTMVGTVVLTGEGVGLVSVAQPEIDEAIRADRDPDATPIRLHIGAPDFSAWARGAAAVAIQAHVGRMA